MFYDFIYLAKGFRMRPKVRSTLSSYVTYNKVPSRERKKVIFAQTPSVEVFCILFELIGCSLFVIVHWNVPWLVKHRFYNPRVFKRYRLFAVYKTGHLAKYL